MFIPIYNPNYDLKKNILAKKIDFPTKYESGSTLLSIYADRYKARQAKHLILKPVARRFAYMHQTNFEVVQPEVLADNTLRARWNCTA
jgi:hypothetical protein